MDALLKAILSAVEEPAVKLLVEAPWLAAALIWGCIIAYKSPELLRETYLFVAQRRRDRSETEQRLKQLEIELTKHVNEAKKIQGSRSHESDLGNGDSHGKHRNLVPATSD